MANTYTQLYVHFVFVVSGRGNFILPKWNDELYKYITGVVQNRKHKMICINGMPDHIHMFVGLNPSQSISDLMRDVKANASKFINDKGWIRGKFEWQGGYGGFTYSRSQIDTVYKYIENQVAHHKISSFKEEYMKLLEKFEIEYDEKYLFEFY